MNTASKIRCAARETVTDTSDPVISRISIIKEKLPDLDPKQLEQVIRATVVGNLNAVMPCVLKDLPVVAKSLVNRAGRIAPHKLFDRIPAGVKLTEESIVEFLKVHDVSHRVSIKNNPAKAGDVNNVVFEVAWKNRVRGSRNMSCTEFQSARFSNTITGIKCGFKTAVGTAGKGALFGALLETPVTVIENALYVKNNRKSVEDARIDIVRDVGISAGLAGATTVGFTGLGLIGVTLGAAAIPLAIVGGAMYTWSATDRIWKALDDTTKERLMNSNPMQFLTPFTHYEGRQEGVSSLKMLPG
jgi:hypothetical protein